MDLKLATRKEMRKSPSGYPYKGYIFECILCKKETFKTAYYAKIFSGYCRNCFSKIKHTKDLSKETEKICVFCNELKPIDFFRKREKHRRNECNECINLVRSFGINFIIYKELLLKQNSVCDICKLPEKNRKLAVDHCHKTGKIRSLLCTNCNTSLGGFKDNINLLESAIKYLRKYES